MIVHTLKDKCIIDRLSDLLLVDIIAVPDLSHIRMYFA